MVGVEATARAGTPRAGRRRGQRCPEHEAIYAALVDRDPNLAQAAALMHVSTTEQWPRRVHAAADDAPSPSPSPLGTTGGDRGRYFS